MKGVYDATRRLCNDGPKRVGMVRSKEGRLSTKEDNIKARWPEHFVKVLNRPVSEVTADELNDSIDTGGIIRNEIKSSLADMERAGRQV